MNLHNVTLEKTAYRPGDYPQRLPEFAFVGRSNVGKSSMLNKLLGRKNLARVSGEPGKTRPAVPMREKSEDGIVVQGLSNCLVKFSKCCTPVPGDDIVGFITRGYGVSVHRADCPNAAPERRRPEEAGRWVKVSWGKDVKQSYQTSLDIYAKDRIDLVLDVSAVLSSTQTRVAGLNAKTTADGFALIHLEIFVADSEQLSAVMRRLHQISGVMKVDRPAG